MKVNLIMPTIGRVKEIFYFASSVEHNDEQFLLISDQNPEGFIPIDRLKSEIKNMTVNYFHSDKKGLSYNRNFLLKQLHDSSGIISFPDDDCIYYSDTLRNVENYFSKNPDVDVVLGCIYDRHKKEYHFKPWPSKKKKVNRLNVYFMASSITIFLRKKTDVNFDELMGAGASYGSCEDPDFLYNLIKEGAVIFYEPSIQVWHPAPEFTKISLEKTYSYSRGFGYFVRKDTDVFKVILLFLLVIKKVMQFLLKKSNFPKGYFASYFSGLYDGFTRK